MVNRPSAFPITLMRVGSDPGMITSCLPGTKAARVRSEITGIAADLTLVSAWLTRWKRKGMAQWSS